MRHLKECLTRIVHRTNLEFTRKMRNLNEETGRKLLQYFMLCVLLFLCFVLPKMSAEKSVRESTGSRGVYSESAMQESAGSRGVLPESAASEKKDAGGSAGTIVIDPGHGGDDPGMIGGSGINEKVLNLVYAKKLAALFTEAGYRVVMTRETEEGLYDADSAHKKAQDMQRRVAIIAEEQPLVTVSIHQNSYPDPSVSGPQVFYYEHSAEGEKLAKCIQDSMNTGLAVARPRVQKGNSSYYILKRSEGTTVIVECGFLSCPEEEQKLQQEDYQDQAAKAIFEGVEAYLEVSIFEETF